MTVWGERHQAEHRIGRFYLACTVAGVIAVVTWPGFAAGLTQAVPDCAFCDGSMVVVDENVVVDFNPFAATGADPTCDDGTTDDLCAYFTWDTSGATAETWKAVFNVGPRKLFLQGGATLTVAPVPNTGNTKRAPGIEITSTCAVEVAAGAAIVVEATNQQGGDIKIQANGDITINGLIRNELFNTHPPGEPGSIFITSCCGDIVTGPTSRIETIGTRASSDIHLTTCCTDGDIVINGFVWAFHRHGTPPTINIVSQEGFVTIKGNNDFGDEGVAGSTVRRTSGVLVQTLDETEAGHINIQAKKDVTVVGNVILNKNRKQYGAVAIKPHSTNGQGGDGAILVVSLDGGILASDRAFDFENRQNALNEIMLQARNNIDLDVTAGLDDGALTNAKPVVNSQGGDTGQGGTNTLRSFSGAITVGPNAQILADFVGRPGVNGTNLLIACLGVTNSGSVLPADGNLVDDAGSCVPVAPALAVLVPQCTETPLPVELTRFNALVDGRAVLLSWETASETNNAGFEVQQAMVEDAVTLHRTQAWKRVSFVDGHGTTLVPQVYKHRMERLDPGRYRFRLKQIDYDGTFAYSPEVDVVVALAERSLVEPVFPNPFSEVATLRFAVQRTQQVRVELYDLLGRRVRVVYETTAAPGVVQTVPVEGRGLPGGTYVIRVVGEHFLGTQLLVLIR